MGSPLRIIHLEDNVTDSVLVGELLDAGGIRFEMERVDTRPAYGALLEKGEFDLILADYLLPSFDGFEALRLAHELRPELPFIFVSDSLDEEVALESLKVGATDYVFKSRMSRLVPAVLRALREAKERVRRDEAEKALRLSESYLIEAQRLSSTGSFGVDLTSGRILWSAETFRIFELDPSTTPTPELILELTHPEDRLAVRRFMDEAASRKTGLELEHRIVMPDGSIKHVRVVGRPTENQLQVIGAVTDITETRCAEVERRRAEEALRATEAALAHAARLMTIGELSVSIAHEVNQPLTAILLNGKACLRWLAADPPDPAEARIAVQRVVDDAVRAGEVIGRIRALTRKTTEAEMSPLDLNETIEQVLVIARSELQRARVAFRAQLQEDLPLVTADRIQVQQLLLNLVNNAMEAMSSVGDRPRELLVATGENGAGKVQVAVKDSGVGVDPGSRGRLFDAFYTTKPGGMGMGLSISRSIVQSHGGELWAEANAGPGATFRFTLPKFASAAPETPRADPP